MLPFGIIRHMEVYTCKAVSKLLSFASPASYTSSVRDMSANVHCTHRDLHHTLAVVCVMKVRMDNIETECLDNFTFIVRRIVGTLKASIRTRIIHSMHKPCSKDCREICGTCPDHGKHKTRSHSSPITDTMHSPLITWIYALKIQGESQSESS